jgi:acetyl esterase/lipase
MFASWGYIVVAPDYLGLKSTGAPSTSFHPYLVAEPTALASIDMVRAAKALLEEQGVAGRWSGDVVVLGVSQGGHAAAFVTRYAPHYAPELDIAGAVYAVPPLDLVGESIAGRQSDEPATKGNAAAFLVVAHDWYDQTIALTDALVPPFHESIVDDISSTCGSPGPDVPVDEIFTPHLLDSSLPEPWTCMGVESSILYTSVPYVDDTPALMVLADNDELVARDVERETFMRLCDDGVALSYLECQDSEHVEGFTYSIDDAFNFLDDRLAGLPQPDVCVFTDVRQCSSDPR